MKQKALKVIITNSLTLDEVMQTSASVGNTTLVSESLKEQLLANDSPGG